MDNCTNFKYTQEGKIQLRNPVHKEAYPVFGLNTKFPKEASYSISCKTDIIKGIGFYGTSITLVMQSNLVGFAHLAYPVGAVPSDVNDVSFFII